VQLDDIKRMVADGFRARSARDRRPFEQQMESFARLRHNLDRHQTRVTLLFSEGEPLLREMQEEGALPPESGARIRCVRVPAGGHAFRPLWVQKLVHDLIDHELEAALRASPQRMANRLYPSEAACLLRHQPWIAGRDVLDVGAGAGRLARYLAPLAAHYEGIDYSPVMINFLRSSMPELSVHMIDFRNLKIFAAESFDFVIASDNVIDALAPLERSRALEETRRVLRPGGRAAFSSHNLRYRHAFSGPRIEWSSNPIELAINCAKYLRGCWNHLRVAPLRKTASDYAILNDPGHFYACLHYYAARSTVRAQLADRGLRLIDTFDITGRLLAESDDDSDSPSLTYVAERTD
jgi:SAM-dependent methyltransferase